MNEMPEEYRSYVICSSVNLYKPKEEDYACIVPEVFYEVLKDKFDIKSVITVTDQGIFIANTGSKQIIKVPETQKDEMLEILDRSFHIYALAFAVAKPGTKLYEKITVSRSIVGKALLRERYVTVTDASEMFDVILVPVK